MNRQILTWNRVLRWFAAPAAALMLGIGVPVVAHAQQQFTDWGWPLPREQVSQKSIAWLKAKGWWPLSIAYQAPWSGQNTVNVIMDREHFLAQRGLETKTQAFDSGPAINEVMVSGRFQVGSGGNFPFSSLLDKKIPVTAIAIESPNLLHALIVPLNSRIHSFKDLKGSNPPAAIGLVTGSSAEFYLQMAAVVNGVTIGKDIILKNMTPGDQMAMPEGLAGVVSWDPTAALITSQRKNGRIVDSIFPYNIYEGQYYVRNELVKNVPDVVQALSDAFVEATLWIRLHPRQAADLMAEVPQLKSYSKAILLGQVQTYNNLYKPTYVYPNAHFWGQVNAGVFHWLYENKRIVRPLNENDFVTAVDPSFMGKTFAKLGWAIPQQPPFIPAGWKGDPSKLPYPPYLTSENLKQPQAFPEKGDLLKPWSFNRKTFSP
jgi:ABC-type nitrate/sulfonate/bicarbonate transport system substrate-binding protein